MFWAPALPPTPGICLEPYHQAVLGGPDLPAYVSLPSFFTSKLLFHRTPLHIQLARSSYLHDLLQEGMLPGAV